MFNSPKIRKIAEIVFTICGGWTGLMSGGLSIPFAIAALTYQGHERRIFILLAFCALVVFAIRVVWKNYTLMEKPDAQKLLPLEIEFIPSAPTPAKKHPCQILVRNNNPKQNADNLKVELLSFTDNLSGNFSNVAKAYYHPTHFDKVAELKSATGRNSINPGDELEFTVFYFEMGFRVQGQSRSFVVKFDLDKPIDKNTAVFHDVIEYRIRFAASARGMARVEKEFKMVFSDEDGIGRIDLKPIVHLSDEEKRRKSEKAIEKLTDFSTCFLQRINDIKAITPADYNPQKDDVLWNTNNAAIAYIVLNLNQDAGKVYDEGVAEINSCSVRSPGVGSTRYEDDYNIVLARFNRRLLNIKRIVDEIEKYIK